ncbi:MAG: PAS domain S-box protein [Spirochaetes bacterium]|nr:MAG: PAS domain S-box protein [Spirochaetota bacterium]
MNEYLIIPFVAFCINLFALGHLTALDMKSPANRSFLYLTAATTLWQLGGWGYYMPPPESYILPWMRAHSAIWQLVGFFAVNFAYRYAGRPRDAAWYAVLAAGVAFSLAGVSTDLVIKGYTRFPWGVWFDGGPLYYPSLFATLIIPVCIAPLVIAGAGSGADDTMRRCRRRIIILGFVFSLATGVLFHLVLALLVPFKEMVRYDSPASAILTMFILYAIARYRLLSPGPEHFAGDIFRGVHDGVLILDGRGEVAQMNPAAREIFGRETGTLRVSELREMIHGYDPGADYTAFRTRAETVSGERILLLSQSGIGPREHVTGRILLVKDATQEDRALLELRDSEERFRTLVEEISDIIYTMTLEGVLTYVSPVVREVLGYEADELRGEDYREFIHPDDLPGALAHFQKVLEIPVEPYEYRIRTKPGEYKHVMVSCTPISFEGRFIGMRGVITDYEVIRSAQEALRESERRYRLITQNVSDVIWMMDLASMRMTFVSPSVSRVLGQSVEENKTTPMEERISAGTLARAMEILADELAHDSERDPDRSRIIYLEEHHGSGRWIHTEARITFLRDTEGRPVELLGLTRDITSRKKLEDELRDSLEVLRAKSEEIEKDLAAAQVIQKALLPDGVPETDRLRIDFRYRPVAQVGGDFFNFIKFEEGGVGVFLGDVAGHGVPAALFLSLVKSTTNRLFRKYALAPATFMEKLNNELVGSMQSYFITAAYGVFEFHDGAVTLRLANGGHPHPLIYRHASRSLEFVKVRGTLVGAFEDMRYEDCTISLDPGDRIYLYTDGFPEAMNREREMIGFERMTEMVKNSYRHEIRGTLDAIIDEVERFLDGEPIADDLVLIGIEIL